jgi:hypothetical protein
LADSDRGVHSASAEIREDRYTEATSCLRRWGPGERAAERRSHDPGAWRRCQEGPRSGDPLVRADMEGEIFRKNLEPMAKPTTHGRWKA